jgi:hypothetical protein
VFLTLALTHCDKTRGTILRIRTHNRRLAEPRAKCLS